MTHGIAMANPRHPVEAMGKIDVSVFFGHHDSNIAFADEGEILLVLEAERVFGRKHCLASADEMKLLIKAGLEWLGTGGGEIGTIYLAILNNQFPPGDIEIGGSRFRPVMTRHHENHIGCGIAEAGDNTLIMCADGGSEDGTTRMYWSDGKQLHHLENLSYTPASGKFYGTLTQMVVNPGFLSAHAFYPGKTMGLAGVGTVDPTVYALLEQHAPEMCNDIRDIGPFLGYFGLSEDYSNFWLDEKRVTLAATGQRFWEDRMLEAVWSHQGSSTTLILVGGCALNVMLNARLLESGRFERVIVSPVSGDCGQAVGALLYANPRRTCKWPYLGRGFGETRVLPELLVSDLAEGKIVGWYNGRSEVGPRSLGNRSILGVPSEGQKEKMNRIKGREPFRPVAPIVAMEKADFYFELQGPSPFMNFSVKANGRTRQLAPAIVHDDGTSRVQTVTAEENPMMHALLHEVEAVTGVPILMNSSFNVAGDPIVDTPEDALRAFKKSRMDVCYINAERHFP